MYAVITSDKCLNKFKPGPLWLPTIYTIQTLHFIFHFNLIKKFIVDLFLWWFLPGSRGRCEQGPQIQWGPSASTPLLLLLALLLLPTHVPASLLHPSRRRRRRRWSCWWRSPPSQSAWRSSTTGRGWRSCCGSGWRGCGDGAALECAHSNWSHSTCHRSNIGAGMFTILWDLRFRSLITTLETFDVTHETFVSFKILHFV